jgi:trk system potassium uptake protein TrkA
MKKICVIGVGNFGYHVARTLYQAGHEVVVIDSDHGRVQRAQEVASYALLGDAANKQFLLKQGIAEMDAVVVSTGERGHLATLITLYLKEIGCKRIIVKALNDDHGTILRKVGASELVFPEKDVAIKIARNLASPNVLDFLPMADEYSISEVAPPKHFLGRNLIQLDLRSRYELLVIGIKDVLTDRFTMLPPANYVIKDSDLLIIFGKTEDVAKATGP